MSLIVYQPETLKDCAVVLIKSTTDIMTTESSGDITKIISNGTLVGINIKNAKKYFDVQEGVHSISASQKKFFTSAGINFDFSGHFVVGEIIKRTQHPKSDKLFVLDVKTKEELKIVTNSLNSLEGKKVVVAEIGAILPSGLEIVPSKVMGVLSQGMLCGGETLLKEPTEGVLIVEDFFPGNDFIL